MKKNELYSIRVEKAIEGSSIFYVADQNLSFVVNKFYQDYPDAQINKITYEGVIYV